MQRLFQWEKPNKVKGTVAVSKSGEEVEQPAACAGRRERVEPRRQEAPAGRGGMATFFSAKLGAAKLVFLRVHGRLFNY